MKRLILDILLSLFFILLQTTLVKYLAIGSIVPDIPFIWIVYLAIRSGQVTGTAAGFLIGLTFDLLSGSEGMLGLGALSKTLGGFVAGYFYNENKTFQTLGGYQFIVAIIVTSLVKNLIYFVIFLQGVTSSWDAVVLYGIPTTLYSAVLALVPMFAVARKHLA